MCASCRFCPNILAPTSGSVVSFVEPEPLNKPLCGRPAAHEISLPAALKIVDKESGGGVVKMAKRKFGNRRQWENLVK